MHVIVNPAAAGGRVGVEWPHLRKHLEEAAIDLSFTITEAPGHATELTRAALEHGHQVVVALGGDGTICEVIQGLHDAGRGALGILPLGTGNDAARTLGLPTDLDGALAVLRNGRRRRVDLMRIGERVVFNAVGIGLLGDINRRSASIKFTRGIAAYLVAALASLFRYPGPTVSLQTEGFSYRGAMMILAVHCGPTTGGGFRLAPKAIPDDGLLDACLVGDLSPALRLHRLVTALRGTLGEQKGSRPFTFRRLELATEVALPAHIDGNPYVIEPPGTVMEVLPGALEVLTG